MWFKYKPISEKGVRVLERFCFTISSTKREQARGRKKICEDVSRNVYAEAWQSGGAQAAKEPCSYVRSLGGGDSGHPLRSPLLLRSKGGAQARTLIHPFLFSRLSQVSWSIVVYMYCGDSVAVSINFLFPLICDIPWKFILWLSVLFPYNSMRRMKFYLMLQSLDWVDSWELWLWYR